MRSLRYSQFYFFCFVLILFQNVEALTICLFMVFVSQQTACFKRLSFSSFVDTAPPSFNDTCPHNMVFYAAECSSSGLITWNEPVATDNSGHVSISYPTIRSPANLSIGLYSVLYSAIDSSGNQANCTFIVQVASKSILLSWGKYHDK